MSPWIRAISLYFSSYGPIAPIPALVSLEAVYVMCIGKLSTVTAEGKGKGPNQDKGEDQGKCKVKEQGKDKEQI